MAKRKLGHEAKLYRNTGTFDVPVWTEIDNVRDLTRSLEKGEADVTTRANAGWTATTGALKDLSLEFQMVYDPEDENVTALEDAYFDGDQIEFAIMDGDINVTDNKGVRATMEVFNFSQAEALAEAILIDVSLKPTYADNPPQRYVVP